MLAGHNVEHSAVITGLVQERLVKVFAAAVGYVVVLVGNGPLRISYSSPDACLAGSGIRAVAVILLGHDASMAVSFW